MRLDGSIGTLVGIDSPVVTEMVSALGFDFLFLDLEHGLIAEHDLALHVLGSRVPVMARIRDGSETAVKRAADAGVHAVVIPHVRSAAMASQAVRWVTYPPAGERSVGLSRSALLGYDLAGALQRADRPAVICQIEDLDGVRDIAGICRVDGLDGLFIGPFDLSASLGAPGDWTAPAFIDAVGAVVTAAHDAGRLVGVFAPSVPAWFEFRARGCDYVVLRSDTLFLADAATAALREAHGHPATGAGAPP